MVKEESKYEKSLSLKMSEEEHKAIKTIADQKGMTIKGLLFQALDRFIPNWRSETKK